MIFSSVKTKMLMNIEKETPKISSLERENERLRELLKTVVRREKAPENLRQRIRLMIREK